MAKPRAQRLLTKIAPPLRRAADRIARLLDHPADRDAVLKIDDIRLAGVKTRKYLPPDARQGSILFVHGGGWMMGGPQAHGALMQQMAQTCQRVVLSLDYGLAPEVPVDEAFDQVAAAIADLHSQSETPLIVIGESAGAMMIARAALLSPKHIDAVILVCPILDFTRTVEDLPQKGAPARLVKTVVNMLWPLWSDIPKAARKELSPLTHTAPRNHPPTLIVAGNADPLKMDAIAYEKKLGARQIDVTLAIYPRVTHGFFSVARVSKTGRQTLDFISAWINERF